MTNDLIDNVYTVQDWMAQQAKKEALRQRLRQRLAAAEAARARTWPYRYTVDEWHLYAGRKA